MKKGYGISVKTCQENFLKSDNFNAIRNEMRPIKLDTFGVHFFMKKHNRAVNGKITYYPIYMTMFLNDNDLKLPKIVIESF